jgi:methyl-accepting chemotaxis protein
VSKPFFLLTSQVLPILQAALRADRDALSTLTRQHPKTVNSLTPVTEQLDAWHRRLLGIAQPAVDSLREATGIMGKNAAFAKEVREIMDNVTGVATAVEEMAATAIEISGAAQQTAKRAEESAVKNAHGNESISSLMGDMGLLEGAVREMADSMGKFVGFSQEINKLTAIVRDIAHQTNLLALNAAIEAARAGEAGRGFAVVADEVKKLADKTAQATGEIESVTNTMNALSSTVGEAVNTSLGRLAKSNDALEVVATVFAEGTSMTRDVNDRVHQIAAAAEEQSVVSAEMARSLSTVTDTLRKEGGQVEAIGQHGRTLVEHTRKVFEGLAGFGHEELLLQVAKSDHLLWKAKLAEVIYGRQNLSEGEIKDHTQCRLGRWYYGDGRAHFGELAPFRAMEAPHAAVHRLGREIAELSAKGAIEEAVTRLEQLDQHSEQIFAHIDALLAELHRG